MAHAVVPDEALDPKAVGLLGPDAVVPSAQGGSHVVHESRPAHRFLLSKGRGFREEYGPMSFLGA
jgi:hypothetical protein